MKTEPTCPKHPDRRGCMDGVCAECYFEQRKQEREKHGGRHGSNR